VSGDNPDTRPTLEELLANGEVQSALILKGTFSPSGVALIRAGWDKRGEVEAARLDRLTAEWDALKHAAGAEAQLAAEFNTARKAERARAERAEEALRGMVNLYVDLADSGEPQEQGKATAGDDSESRPSAGGADG
jgi:hypothetical protein